MIETKQIRNMVKHIVRRDKGISDRQIMHPMREWLTGLAIVFSAVLFGGSYCFYIYNYYLTQVNAEIVSQDISVPYQDVLVQKTLKVYGDEKTKYQNILGKGLSKNISNSTSTAQINLATSSLNIKSTATTTNPKKIVTSTPIQKTTGLATSSNDIAKPAL